MRRGLQGVVSILLISSLAAVALGRNGFDRQRQVRPVREVVVIDSKGKVVGVALGGIAIHNREIEGGSNLRIRSIILLHVGQEVVPVAVGRDRFYGGGGVFFELEDCQGNPWLIDDTTSSEPPPLFPRVAIGAPGQTLYGVAPGAMPQSITTESRWSDMRGCINQTFTFDQVKVLPAQPLVNLQTEFTPPFSLKASP